MSTQDTIRELLGYLQICGLNNHDTRHAKKMVEKLINSEVQAALDRLVDVFELEGVFIGGRSEKMSYKSTIMDVIEAERKKYETL